ncbi:hypothetical protein KEM63_01475 [Halopseudomonas nanhaiensis]|uniref:hypothetical protein n=1 Tax=Halopseudomonas nanhaiensis TaxID=2830842 RepID=UPI001CC12C66|nr:hypothetical protein [Halopseudomonas nanhaiensis]UAW98683.1 hypothetical protein KEM63_01475 [Halopseudomonas nanhaiensis]
MGIKHAVRFGGQQSENQHEQANDDQQADEEDDTDRTGEKFKHATLLKKGDSQGVTRT